MRLQEVSLAVELPSGGLVNAGRLQLGRKGVKSNLKQHLPIELTSRTFQLPQEDFGYLPLPLKNPLAQGNR